MKGGVYGVRSKQTSIILVSLVCATILTWPLQLPSPGAEQEAIRVSPKFGKANLTKKHHENEEDISDDQESSVNEHFDSAAMALAPVRSSSSIDGGKQSKESSHLVAITSQNEGCNCAKGKWVVDNNRPLYSGFGCKRWLSRTKACRQTQRTDFDYEKVRWLPKECRATDEFTGYRFLQRMMNKTLAFIGDSLGGQQFESLMCMVTGGHETPEVVNVGKEYGLVNLHGSDGRAYRFLATNTTILHYWSASLCDLEPIDDTTDHIAMHLDRPPSFLQLYIHKLDVLVLSTWNHWNPRKFKENRWIMHVGGAPHLTDRNNISTADDIGGGLNFTVHSIVHWVDSQLPKHPGLKAFYRSLSPRHFSKGEWNTGGSCYSTRTLAHGSEVIKDESSDSVGSEAVKGTKVKLLDITALSQLRNEAHISRWKRGRSGVQQDCLHWCLPGVPDTWNEILFAQI